MEKGLTKALFLCHYKKNKRRYKMKNKLEYRILGEPVDIKTCNGYIPIVKTERVSTGLIPQFYLQDEDIVISRCSRGMYRSPNGLRYFAIELVEYDDDGYECDTDIMGFLIGP